MATRPPQRSPMFHHVICIFLFALLGTALGVEFRTVEIAGNRVTVCRVDVRKERLQLFHRDGNGQQPHNSRLVFPAKPETFAP